MAHLADLAATFAGRPVLDAHGLPLGCVSHVVRDDAGRPEYIVVDPGILRASKCVPLQGSYATAYGEIVVRWDRARFREAPRADRSHAPA